MCPTKALLLEPWRDCTRHDRYEVCWDGQVRNRVTGRVLRPQLTGKGYAKVNLGRGIQVAVHQLVCEAFHGPKPVGQATSVDHIDFTRLRNCATNLRWLAYGLNSKRHYVQEQPEPDDWQPMTDEEYEAWESSWQEAGW